MWTPFSQEVKAAVDLATELKSHASLAISVVVFISVIHTILLGFFLVAVIGLLITVNPDLAEERKAFVTPVLRWVLLPLRGWTAVFRGKTEAGGRERRRVEGSFESDARNSYDSLRGQRKRRTFLGSAD